jgi:hypothetical protein
MKILVTQLPPASNNFPFSSEFLTNAQHTYKFTWKDSFNKLFGSCIADVSAKETTIQ